MIAELTPDAEIRLEEYLGQVRAALAGAPDVSPDEVEADIREHVENELRHRPRPVARPELEAVLARLGPPTQWLPAGRAVPPAFGGLRQYVGARWRAAREAVWRGPEDWRLPYLTLGVFALSISVFPPFLLVSYFLGRAGIAVAREKDIELGAARKWMLYPPVVLISAKLLIAIALLPPILATGIIASETESADRYERWELAGRPRDTSASDPARRLIARHPNVVTTLDRILAPFPGNRDVRDALGVLFLGTGMLALWLTGIGLTAGRFPCTVQSAFVPLCNGFGGKTARRVGLVSLMIFAVWCGVGSRLLQDAGLM
jgi:hypothetical protein